MLRPFGLRVTLLLKVSKDPKELSTSYRNLNWKKNIYYQSLVLIS